jgi:Family of unknown function (DUF6266)
MGTLLNGINGPVIGKVGPVVGYVWKKKQVIRSLANKSKKPLSPLQLQQRAKFRLMNYFLNSLKDLLNVTYGHLVENMTGFNKAFSYNVKNAVKGNHPDLKVDYTRVLLGRGDLTNVSMPVVNVSSLGTLEFSWTDNSETGSAKATDQVFVAVYGEEQNNWIYGLNLATRKLGSCVIDITRMKGKEVQTYIGFINEQGTDVTDTLYAGSIQL